jgi:hypothetical protein
MSYVNINGGNVVQVAYVNYLAIPLPSNTTLDWPTQFQDTSLVVASQMNVIPTANGFTLTLPDATLTSVGQSFIMTNISAFTFTLNKGDGTLLTTYPVSTANYFYLTDNTTVGGSWTIIPVGGGYAAVTSVAAVSSSSGITIAGSPITSAGTLTFGLGGDLAALNSLATTGIAVRTASSTWTTRTITGDPNITVLNGSGVGGNPQITLNDTLTGLSSAEIADFLLSTNIISTTSGNLNIVLSPNGTGVVSSSSDIQINSANSLQLYNSGNTFYAGLSAGAMTSDITWKLPLADGTANTLLQTDGAQNLSFSTVSTAGIPRAWVVFNGTGSSPYTIIASYNVNQVTTGGGTGLYTISYTTPFGTANQAVIGSCNTSNSADPTASGNVSIVNNASGSVTIATINSANPVVYTAFSYIAVAVF